jgi:DNA-binding GntR family transcriptional regulator
MELERIENKTLRQKVYELLKEKMITAEILPGEQISLRSLAEKLGVSLSPVRDALLQLESERAVVIESNRSIHVNNLTPDEMEEVLRIRITLECMAAERACDFRSEAVLPELRRMLSKMHDSMGQPIVYLRHNQKFHFSIYDLADSPILFDMIARLWVRIGPYIYLHVRERKDISVAMVHHEAIYEALEARDKRRIVRAIQKDLETGAASMKRFMNAMNWDMDRYRENLLSLGEISPP